MGKKTLKESTIIMLLCIKFKFNASKCV